MLPQDPFDPWWVERLAFQNPPLTDEESAFWFARTPTERLQMLELVRHRVYGPAAAEPMRKDIFEIVSLEDLR